MHCPSCAETITQLLSPIRSISDINVSLLLRTVTFATNTRSSTSSGRAEKITRREVVDVLMREGGFIVETEEGQPIKLQTRKLDLDVRAYGLGSWMRGGLSGPTRKQILAMRKEAKRREIHAAHCNACREGRSLVASGTELEPEATGDIEVFRTTLSVRGMTCASCTTSIHSALSSFDDILDVDVNLLASCAVVRHRSTFSAKQVKTAIEDIGFQCDVTSSVADLSDPEGDINKIRTTISIEGMTCASCSSTVSAALREVSGVDQVVVDVIGNKGVVVHAKGVTAEAICLAVEGVGYGAAIISSEPLSFRGTESFERTVKITVSGIYCHECVSKLNRYLALLPVKSTQFTTQSHTTTIKYTPREPLTIRDILKGLSNVSPEFQAVLVRETSLNDRSKDIQKREVRMLLTHWIMAFVFTIPTFVIGIVGMVILPPGNILHEFTMRPTWGAAKMGTIIIWPIATVVQFGVGRLFYERAFAPMRPHTRRLLRMALSRDTKIPKSVSRPLTWRYFFNFGSMDLLVVLSTTVAYFASLGMLIIDATSPSSAESVGSYFDSSVFLIMFILLGRVLEAYAKSRTTDAVSLLGQLRAENALLVEDNSAELGPSPEGLDANHRKTTNVPVGHLEKGDLIIVPPGSLPPTDGIIVAGLTTFDESSLTGESRPVRKGPGDEVFTGTTNLLGAVTIRITTTTGETMLEKIMRAVSEASGHKAPIEKLAESLTGVFVPVIVYLAIIVLTIWLAVAGVGVLSSRESKSGGEYFFAIEFAIATLVVACPCGIGLAVPCANAVGTGLAAREGILATTGGEAFIGATKVGVLVLDKTGTLTVGKSTVTDAENWSKLAGDMEKAERMVLEIERGSTHPLAQGLVTYLESQAQSPYRIEIMSTKESAGRGVAASVALDERLVDVLIGNVALLTENGVTLSSVQNELLRQWSEAAKSVVLVALRSNPSSPYVLTAAYALADPPRETTASALATLREMGMQIKMLSGDNILTAIAVAKMVGIPAENVIAGVSPEGKAHIIRSLQQSSWTRPRPSRLRSMISAVPWFHQFDLWRCRHRLGVMFVGDGLNDSVALAAADVSVAMGHGSQATLAGSDFVLLSSTLSSLPALIKLSKRITRRQKLNLGWACVFNIVCLPFAAGVFYPAGGIRLTPVWSAVIMACSSLSVVCSSIALRWGI